MMSLSTLVQITSARRGQSLVACALGPVLLAGCAGTGLTGAGLAGPSWQERAALHLQEDPHETIEEAAEDMIAAGVEMGWHDRFGRNAVLRHLTQPRATSGRSNLYHQVAGESDRRGRVPYVNGEIHGTAVVRRADGSVSEAPFVNGERHGAQVDSTAAGDVLETSWVNGEKPRSRVAVAEPGTNSLQRAARPLRPRPLQGGSCTPEAIARLHGGKADFLARLSSSIGGSSIRFGLERPEGWVPDAGYVLTDTLRSVMREWDFGQPDAPSVLKGAAVDPPLEANGTTPLRLFQEFRFDARGDVIVYTWTRFYTLEAGVGRSDQPIPDPGPHTAPCRIEYPEGFPDGVLYFGAGTWARDIRWAERFAGTPWKPWK